MNGQTHFIPYDSPGRLKAQALCGVYAYRNGEHSPDPTCPECRAAILATDSMLEAEKTPDPPAPVTARPERLQYSALCTTRGGKLKLYDREDFDRGLAQFGDGVELELSLEVVGEKYTRAQEKYFHGPVLKAFEGLGYHKQEAKEMLCLLFLPQEIRKMDGSVVVVPGRTSKLKKDEYTRFVEQCIQLAAENGQYVEDADTWLAKHRTAA